MSGSEYDPVSHGCNQSDWPQLRLTGLLHSRQLSLNETMSEKMSDMNALLRFYASPDKEWTISEMLFAVNQLALNWGPDGQISIKAQTLDFQSRVVTVNHNSITADVSTRHWSSSSADILTDDGLSPPLSILVSTELCRCFSYGWYTTVIYSTLVAYYTVESTASKTTSVVEQCRHLDRPWSVACAQCAGFRWVLRVFLVRLISRAAALVTLLLLFRKTVHDERCCNGHTMWPLLTTALITNRLKVSYTNQHKNPEL